MRLIVRSAPSEDFAWLVARTSCGVTGGFEAIEAIDSAGHVRGMVGYDGWTKNAVFAHMAVDAPIVWRSLLRPALSYAFVLRNREVMLGCIPSHNKASIKFSLAVGFQIVHRVKDGWAAGDDLVLIELRRRRCRFLDGYEPHSVHKPSDDSPLEAL